MKKKRELERLARLMRYWILLMSTRAGSGHPTSSLSAVELMVVLFFDRIFRFDVGNSDRKDNDRLIFSKGHASPLFYALWAAAGQIPPKDLEMFRDFSSYLEGHPTPVFQFTEAATGSLGQGLSIGFGMALNAKYLDRTDNKVYVLLGDSEMAEGSVWEAIQLAAHYKLNNLIGIIDVNRLGQCGETMYGHDLASYAARIAAFGWKTITVRDGHDIGKIAAAYARSQKVKNQPVMIIARTVKGKGVSFLENKDGWHGKALSETDYARAVKEWGTIDFSVRGEIAMPQTNKKQKAISNNQQSPNGAQKVTRYTIGQNVATRDAYGAALVALGAHREDIVVLDAETSNATRADAFKNKYPERFFEMFIAEQNMVGAAVGLARRGRRPFVSTFAAFLMRAADHIRMARYSKAHITFVGSHAGVSIGQDGVSQMGLEDIAFFRTILDSTVLYPSDAIATEKLVAAAAQQEGIVYIRTTRARTPVLYDGDMSFPIGGSKTVHASDHDACTIVAAGITLHEALRAYDLLAEEKIIIRVIDLYSIKPIDEKTLRKAAGETGAIITVEDHYAEGGIGEAVRSALGTHAGAVYSLAVRKMPHSGTPQKMLDFEEISAETIVKMVRQILKQR